MERACFALPPPPPPWIGAPHIAVSPLLPLLPGTGQHRWVEFKDIHNPDASTIPPEWHGWHTQMQDVPGTSVAGFLEEKLAASHQVAGDAADSSKCYTDHVGLNASGSETEEVMNKTGYRARGYMVGGLKQKPGDADLFHVHPGHALNKKGVGRFEAQKKMHLWDPTDETPPPGPIRSPDVN